jgi:CheY-like chemotaxis protein
LRRQPLILVVDDEADVRGCIREQLETLGYAVEEARNGAEGLTKAMEKRPAAILLDHRLPDFVGNEVHIHLTHLGIHIPTALMSGYPGLDQLARSAGIPHVLAKPVSSDVLESFMVKLLASASSLKNDNGTRH